MGMLCPCDTRRVILQVLKTWMRFIHQILTILNKLNLGKHRGPQISISQMH
ncbi:unnamed protein product, partial [Vitis vinifera]|uniref:Uncharacterized protein n=1 Tax=Vitis vinifera TaxID=29760 RepID=D7UE24_VITVI